MMPQCTPRTHHGQHCQEQADYLGELATVN